MILKVTPLVLGGPDRIVTYDGETLTITYVNEFGPVMTTALNEMDNTRIWWDWLESLNGYAKEYPEWLDWLSS